MDDRKQKFTVSTAHKYKGLEKTVVIIVDAVKRCYPLIHPDWIFMEIFGDNINKITADERRLFYVALSRAVEWLFIITDEIDDPSSFLKNLHPIDNLDWSKYLYRSPIQKNPRIVIKISNQSGRRNSGTYEIRHLLRADNYRWDSRKGIWSKIVESAEFDLHNPFKNSNWISDADGIEISLTELYDADSGQATAIFHIDNGECIRLNFSAMKAKIDNELRRLGWSEQKGKDYLQATYSKRGRSQLSDQQLANFWEYLKQLPSPNPF